MSWPPLRPLLALTLGLSPLLSSCTVVGSVTHPPPTVVRAAQAPALDLGGPAPDVVILAVSGHCHPVCNAPRDNYDYLSDYGTLDRIAREVQLSGLSVQVAGYASGAFDEGSSPRISPPQRGWPALRRDYARLNTVWAADRPRVVLLGHSQGVPWLYALARQFPEQPIDALIELDAMCALWNLDHRAALLRLSAGERGQPDIAGACTPQLVGGIRRLPKDTVPDNVARNLELHSLETDKSEALLAGGRFNPIWARTPNLRADGTRLGINTHRIVGETHSDLSKPGSAAVTLAAAWLYDLAVGWAEDDQQQPPR
ncbi:hypothetical protein [Deinococcus radiophilus]|uniref:Alpha/beta hydrolase n=1 Tax=Deinococcus radiophilus TaxID=32062 RepID=A0A431W0G8_9DEIO|nr:hypothetical protein [Deinococcus radiophilus]RTR28994.1 hypothetical protein EJ104_03870 [Deinococcus radiophilus]UFA49577.1 hypothetical protein LMT64_06615 [Deinococcus radiophilus]